MIGIGCPGHCRNGILMSAANLPTLKEFPIASMLSEAFDGIPTVLLNDADAAIAAEVWGNESNHIYKSYQHIAMITIGTGIGLALILNGQIYRGSNGLIEGGHMIISPHGNHGMCSCGQSGCVESISSAKMTAKRYLDLKLINESDPSFGAKDVFKLAADGDDIAMKVIEEVLIYLPC